MDENLDREPRDEPTEARTEPSIPPKREKVPGSGRVKGTPNRIAGQIRKDAGEFFRSCTSDNLKFRKKLKEFCESGEVLKHSHTLAVLLAHSLGKPVPKVEQADTRSPLLFVTQHPIGSYDPLAAKAAALLERKKQAALPPSADDYVPALPDDPDALVVVEWGPDTLADQVARPR